MFVLYDVSQYYIVILLIYKINLYYIKNIFIILRNNSINIKNIDIIIEMGIWILSLKIN